jgi:hypothetical protein
MSFLVLTERQNKQECMSHASFEALQTYAWLEPLACLRKLARDEPSNLVCLTPSNDDQGQDWS